ncbi:MAG: OmpA family protein [Desulfobulbaceae bacterium]|nr:OmpA family protein [Desulfobulbaceae bacterium]
MDGINLRKIFFWLLCAGCFGTVCPLAAQAADCALLLHDLSQLKGMMQRHELLTEAIKECPDDYQINYYYAYNLERLRRYDQALYYYEAAVRLKPDFAKGYFGIGGVYLALGKSMTAIDSFKKGLSLDPDNVWAQRLYQKALQQDKSGSRVRNEDVVREVESREELKSPTVAGKDEAPVVVQVKQPAEVDSSSQITAEGFVQSMTGDTAKQDSGDQGHALSMQIQFEISSGELTEEAKAMLDSVVCKALQSQELQGRRFEVAGHTDDSGTPEMNMYFSKMRAMRVRDNLVENCGIAPDRLTVVYYGQERPAFPNTSRKNRMLNRRVEFRLLQ